MSATEILIVRHPETQANVNGRFIGRGDSSYTHAGLRQLRRVPRKISAFKPDAMWSSPLQRAHRLAARAARMAGVPLVVDERLLELDFGDAEGLTFEEIAAADMVFNYQNRHDPVAPGGESRSDIERRVEAFCAELLAVGGRHVIVTHGGVVRASLVHLLGLATTDIWAFHIHNAQMAYVRVIDGHGTLEEYVQG